MYFKNKLSIYITRNKLIYVVIKSKKAVHGSEDIRSFDDKSRDKEIMAHISSLCKKHRVSGVYYAIEQGSKITKVIQKDVGPKTKKKSLDALIQREVKDILNQNESINNFLINYTKYDDSFLVSVYSKNIIENICKTYVGNKTNLIGLSVPEEAMFNIIKEEEGICALFYYDGMTLKSVVSVDGKPLFSRKDEKNDETILMTLQDDIADIKDYVQMKTDRSIQKIYIAGLAPDDIQETVPEAVELELPLGIPNTYLIPFGALINKKAKPKV